MLFISKAVFDSGEAQPLALTAAYDNFPLWSPRGDLIMFARLVDDAYEIAHARQVSANRASIWTTSQYMA